MLSRWGKQLGFIPIDGSRGFLLEHSVTQPSSEWQGGNPQLCQFAHRFILWGREDLNLHLRITSLQGSSAVLPITPPPRLFDDIFNFQRSISWPAPVNPLSESALQDRALPILNWSARRDLNPHGAFAHCWVCNPVPNPIQPRARLNYLFPYILPGLQTFLICLTFKVTSSTKAYRWLW